jgi:predicted XRE-type DNA-binding protein
MPNIVYSTRILKPVAWVGTSRADIGGLPAPAQRRLGFDLAKVQRGLIPPDWKPMSAVGPGVRELRVRIGGMKMAVRLTRSSGNVFRDMGFPPVEAANLLLRANLLIDLQLAIDATGLTQSEVAKRLGVTQPRVSDIVRGNFDRFGLDSLVQLLDRLGITVELKTRSRKLSPPTAAKRSQRTQRSSSNRDP